jgi:hypothetical protein
MTKYIYSFIALVSISMNSFSQDVITPVLGNDIQVKVIEVTKTDIAYKKWDNPTGPTLKMPKSEVLIINYANGKKEVLYIQEKLANDVAETKEVLNAKDNEPNKVSETKASVPKLDTSSKDNLAIITLKSGEDIQAFVLEVNKESIVYKTSNSSQDSMMTIPVADVLLISYADGTKALVYKQSKVSDEQQSTLTPKTQLNSDATEIAQLSNAELRMKGKHDAKTNYLGRNSGAGWTAVTALIATPVLGLIPAVACASSTPRERNLNFENTKLKNDHIYYNAYVKQARKTKAVSVLTGYVIGTAAWFILVIGL